jgi:hypothetical protein
MTLLEQAVQIAELIGILLITVSLAFIATKVK